MNTVAESIATVEPVRPTRPFLWSVRRELWENRSLYLTPMAVAALLLVSLAFNAWQMPDGMNLLLTFDPARQRAVVTGFHGSIAMVMLMAMSLVAWFYCLDALHAERRDRSILFWKSMPVSDVTTVLSKLFVVAVLIPAITFVAALVTQGLILMATSAVLIASGASAAPLWANVALLDLSIVLLYVLIVQTLWYAPIFGWLLLVSAWAKRAAFLWALLPPFAIVVFEEIAFNTNYFMGFLQHRFAAGLFEAFDLSRAMTHATADSAALVVEMDGRRLPLPAHLTELLDPVKFFTDPYLWLGLLQAAVFIAATIWMRRYREPL